MLSKSFIVLNVKMKLKLSLHEVGFAFEFEQGLSASL